MYCIRSITYPDIKQLQDPNSKQAVHMVTVDETADRAVSKLLPCVAKHVWGDWGKHSHKELGKFRQYVGSLAVHNVLWRDSRVRRHLEWYRKFCCHGTAIPFIANGAIQEIAHLLYPIRMGPILLENYNNEQPSILNLWHCTQFHHVKVCTPAHCVLCGEKRLIVRPTLPCITAK
jgi:hypothetical protein